MMASVYCTNTEIKAVMPDTTWGTTYDALLTAIAERASRAIDTLTGREPGAYKAGTAAARYFDGSGCGELWVDEMAVAPTAVAVAESGDVDSSAGSGGTYTTWAASDYLLWPANALVMGQPYLRLDVDIQSGSKALWYAYPKAVKITAQWGYSTAVPPDILQATLIQAVRWFKRGQQAFADTGAVTELSQLRYVKALDPDVATMVEHYRRLMV